MSPATSSGHGTSGGALRFQREMADIPFDMQTQWPWDITKRRGPSGGEGEGMSQGGSRKPGPNTKANIDIYIYIYIEFIVFFVFDHRYV